MQIQMKILRNGDKQVRELSTPQQKGREGPWKGEETQKDKACRDQMHHKCHWRFILSTTT
jgi:hypothetical protein